MTTVAAKDGQMAADTQLTGDYTLRVQKLVRLPDGGMAGGAGHWARCWVGLQWLAEGEQGEFPRIKGATILIMRGDGSLHIAESEFPAYPLLDKAAAIGAGSQAAMAAMARGSTAAEAVADVAKLDAFTSGPIQTLTLEPKRGRKPRPRRG